MNQIEKFNKRFSSQLRKNPQTSQENVTAQTQPQTQTQAPAQPEPQVQAPTQPEPKSQPKPRTPKTDKKQTKSLHDNTLPAEVAKDLHDYIYSSRKGNFSDTVRDYIEAKNEEPDKKVPHALNLIKYMWDEFDKGPQQAEQKEARVNRGKVTDMSVMLFDDNNDDSQVAKKAEKFLTHIARVSTNDYVKALNGSNKNHARDKFLLDLAAAFKGDDVTLWGDITENHIQDVLKQIENHKGKNGKPDSKNKIQRNKIRYARFLRDNNFEKFISDELLQELEADDLEIAKQKAEREAERQKQSKNKESKTQTGGTIMSDEKQTPDYYAILGVEPTATDEEMEKAHRELSIKYHPDRNPGNKEAEEKFKEVSTAYGILSKPESRAEYDAKRAKEAQTHKFEPSEIQKKACAYAGLDAEKFENADKLTEALLSAGIIIKGEQILIKDGSKAADNAKAEEEKEKDNPDYKKDFKTLSDKEFEEEVKKQKPLNVNGTGEEKTQENTNGKDKTWVQKKVENYQRMEEEGKFGKINITKGLEKEDTEFEVEVAGGTIHYSSPTNVTVSNEASVTTFEAMLMEDDNVGRPINFGANMSRDMAVRLMAACILHGNPINGGDNVPTTLSKEEQEMLRKELGEERFMQFTEKLLNKGKEGENDKPKTDEPKTDEPKTDEPKTDKKKDKVEIIITTPEELDKFLTDAQKARTDLKKLYENGDIAFSSDKETKEAKIIAGPNLESRTDLTDAQKQQLLDDANSKSDLLVAVKQAHDKYNKQKLETIHKKMIKDDEEKMRKGEITGKEKIAKHKEKVDNVALIHAKRMGLLKPEEKVTRMVKEGDKFVEKEVETITDITKQKEYSANLSETTHARIAQVMKQRGGNDGK